MVTLTCRARQTLTIGEGIEITVVEIAPGLVRLGICAPGQTVTRLDPVPLPVGKADLGLAFFQRSGGWPGRGK